MRHVLRWTRAATLWAFAMGGLRGLLEYAQREWVREFQAGAPSPLRERVLAMAERASFEALGFGALALVLGLAALALGPVLARARTRGAPPPSEQEPGARFAAQLTSLAFAAALWVLFGAWLAGEALPFLGPGALALLDLAGLLVGLALGELFEHLAVRLPGRAAGDPFARALASRIALAAGLRCAWLALTHEPRGALQWTLAALCAPAALLLARFAMARLERTLAGLRALGADRRLAPRALAPALGVLLAACALATALNFDVDASAEASAAVEHGQGAPALAHPRGADTGPNVVYITVDTLRADALSCYGYPRATTPFLDRLAAEGTRCADITAAAAWTKPSTGTLLTGLYPSRHGALYHGSELHTPEGGQTLAEAFREAGCTTAGFVSNPNIKAVFGFDRGFDLWFDAPAEDTLTLSALRDALIGEVVHALTRYQFNWKYANDIDALNQRVLPWLEAHRSERFFLYLHYIDPHEPYAPPPSYARDFAQDHGLALFNERKRLVGRDLYDGEVRYTDDGLARVYAKLDELGLLDSTLIALTSDHGEEFFEHGALGHGFSLFQEVVHVPLILRGPGVAAGRVLEAPLPTRDLPATLLELARTGRTSLGDGHSFAASLAPAPAAPAAPEAGPLFLESEFGQDENDLRSFVFSGVRAGSLKLVLTEHDANNPVGPGGRQQLFDLATDREERRDRMHDPELKPRVIELLEALRAHSQMLDETGFRHIRTALLSPEVRANLKALGYL